MRIVRSALAFAADFVLGEDPRIAVVVVVGAVVAGQVPVQSTVPDPSRERKLQPLLAFEEPTLSMDRVPMALWPPVFGKKVTEIGCHRDQRYCRLHQPGWLQPSGNYVRHRKCCSR